MVNALLKILMVKLTALNMAATISSLSEDIAVVCLSGSVLVRRISETLAIGWQVIIK